MVIVEARWCCIVVEAKEGAGVRWLGGGLI
jgi:hypothetical protein